MPCSAIFGRRTFLIPLPGIESRGRATSPAIPGSPPGRRRGAIFGRESRLFNRLRRHFRARATRKRAFGGCGAASRHDAFDRLTVAPDTAGKVAGGVSLRPLDGSARNFAGDAGSMEWNT